MAITTKNVMTCSTAHAQCVLYIHEKIMVGPDKPAIPGQRCFELVSSHQQGIRMTCPAHHRALYARGEPECLCTSAIAYACHIRPQMFVLKECLCKHIQGAR